MAEEETRCAGGTAALTGFGDRDLWDPGLNPHQPSRAAPQSRSAAPGCQWPQVFLLETQQSCPHAAQAALPGSKEKGLILPARPLGSRVKSPQKLGMFP